MTPEDWFFVSLGLAGLVPVVLYWPIRFWVEEIRPLHLERRAAQATRHVAWNKAAAQARARPRE